MYRLYGKIASLDHWATYLLGHLQCANTSVLPSTISPMLQAAPSKSLIYKYHYETFEVERCRSSTLGISHILIPPKVNYALLPMAGYFFVSNWDSPIANPNAFPRVNISQQGRKLCQSIIQMRFMKFTKV